MSGHDYDVLVVGSGFGGSVTALRLSEKGYRVGVLEAGRRWSKESFPKTSWDLRHYLWLPWLGMRGIQRLTLLRDIMVISGSGVGGGSLVYANTLYEPLERFFHDSQWADLTNWREELAPHYDQAKRMLGAETTPFETPAEDVMREVARRLDCEDTFHHTDVGVYFGEQGVEVDDPFFGGEGPRRTGCVRCGGCVNGCRYGAKNTLDQNYLYLAEKLGTDVHPDSEVIDLEPLVDGGGKLPRPLRFVLQILQHPLIFLRSLSMWRWTERSIILLVMQDLDNSLKVRWKVRRSGRVHLTTEQGDGDPNPTWIPVANKAARIAADVMHGAAGGSLAEAVLNVPTTAHILGGCPIGADPERGVIDGYQRVYGHPGLHVADGSAISANLGVNPSLTITAQTERAMSFWPNKGEEDLRPPLADPYRRIEPTAPKKPAVPAGAPGALRW